MFLSLKLLVILLVGSLLFNNVVNDWKRSQEKSENFRIIRILVEMMARRKMEMIVDFMDGAFFWIVLALFVAISCMLLSQKK